MKRINLFALAAIIFITPFYSQKKDLSKKKEEPAASAKSDKNAKATETIAPILKSETYSDLSFRGIGPAVTSGRVIDIIVNPKNKSVQYPNKRC